ncbi:MAG: MBL fold metallo-hydrolase [Pseudomonadota bacterium]
MKLTVVGSGDAFGSGGRLQTCFHVSHPGGRFLIDCGATTMIGMQRCGLDPNDVSLIFISHLHGDHFSGLVWWILHAQYVGKRTTPLTIVGPPGLEERYLAASAALFPSAKSRDLKFDVIFEVYAHNGVSTHFGIEVEVQEVSHPCGAPPYALRLQVAGKTIAFSGDTEWVDGLTYIARNADLFICECYAHQTKTPYHMSWAELRTKFPSVSAKKILLTHMNDQMLACRDDIDLDYVSFAEDGLVVDV